MAKSGSSRAARSKVMTLRRGPDRVTFRLVDRKTTVMKNSKGEEQSMSRRAGRSRVAKPLLPAGGFKIVGKRKRRG